MSIIDRPAIEVQPTDWHTDEPTPIEALIPPAEPDCPCEREQARYVVLPKFSAKLDRMLYWAFDRSEDRKVRWHISHEDAARTCEDLNAEDFPPIEPDGSPWWATLPTEPGLDEVRYEPTPRPSACPASARWTAEGLARQLLCGSTRGDLYGRDAE